MLAAARKHKRVVQVGTQRRSTPHLIEARDRIVREGKLGKIGLVEIYCYYHMRARDEPARHRAARVPRLRNVDRPGADAAVQRDRPSARLAGVHGIRQRHRGRHVHSHARHGPLDARPRLAEADRLDRRHPRRQGQQGQHHRHADGHVRLRRPGRRLAASHLGRAEPDPKYPWGATIYGDKGTLKAERPRLRLHPARRRRRRSTGTSTYELEQYPEDKTEKDLERHVAPAIRGHMKDFLAAIGTRGKPVADIEQGHISTASCILANLAHAARPDADLGRRARARSSATTRRTGCCAGRIARRGCIPPPGACE